jgi:phage terminase Nu1 subunit (DNA packaging protein)
MARGKKPSQLDHRVTLSEAGEYLGKQQAQLLQWIKQGKLPDSGTDGKWSLQELIKDYVAIYENREGANRETESKIRLNDARAEKTELEIRMKAGELVEAAPIAIEWGRLVTRCKTSLLQIPQALAPTLADTQKPMEVERILSDRIHEALEHLANDR